MTRYPKSVQILHWLMAAGLIAMVLVGLYMGSLPLSDERRNALMLGHLATGLLLLIAAVIRLRWRGQGRMPGCHRSIVAGKGSWLRLSMPVSTF